MLRRGRGGVSWGLDREVLQCLRLGWPVDYGRPGAGHWVDQILTGMRSHGVRVERRPIPQTFAETLLIEVDGRSGRRWVAIDYNDSPAVHIDLAAEALVYFKLQFAQEGYEFGSVVAGGYVPANQVVYRYLPLLRAIRARRRFRYDVYGRFGLERGGGEIRRKAVELLSARADFSYEGNLFRYPGGPPKVPYQRYMFEIPYAKVCVHMPGAGDLCFRLIDYLAVGACVVGPPPRVRLPVPLLDGVHLVHCATDLSDLGDICAQLLADDAERERIARNGRDYFDRYLHRRQLGAYYLSEIVQARQPSG